MKVAVIIPTCNRPELLKRAVASAFNQTRKPDEVIVVNDGDEFQVEWRPSLKVLNTERGYGRHRGPAVARNIGIKSTDCEIICYVDDDDELLPNHVELLSNKIEEGARFAFSRAIYRYPNGTETEDPEPNNHDPNKGYYNPKALLKQNIAPISSFAHTRESWANIGKWDEELPRMEDWDFWGRLFIHYGEPSVVDAVTNVIYKGLGTNRTDANMFTYSMSCSWGDIVKDRLHYMSQLKRGFVTEPMREKFHIPRVGVVMPVYNGMRYISGAIESILAQTYRDFEIIVVNDGSTDNTEKILQMFAMKDRRIRIFSTPNQGVTKALNYGVMLSRSEFVARMDADDICHPERFAKQIEFMDQNKDVYVLGTWFNSMTSDMSQIVWSNQTEQSHDLIIKTLAERCCIGHPTVMMRRKLFEVLGGYSEAENHKHIEDYEFWVRVSERFKVANLPEFLLLHRTHNAQVSSVSSELQKVNAENLRRSFK